MSQKKKNSIVVKPKYMIGDKVQIKLENGKIFVITGLLIRDATTYTYDCMDSDGGNQWMRESEIDLVEEDTNRIGFEITVETVDIT